MSGYPRRQIEVEELLFGLTSEIKIDLSPPGFFYDLTGQPLPGLPDVVDPRIRRGGFGV
jgi:hypothetical protein